MRLTHASKLVFTVLILTVSLWQAKASDLFTYQGKLTDAVGGGLPDGQYRLGVRIWDLSIGGTVPLWARKYDVPVVGGLFSVMIGTDGIAWDSPSPPLTASLKLAVSGTNRFLEITVMSAANGPEKTSAEWQVLAPRQQLNAVPYAMNGCPPGTVLPFAGADAPEGWRLCNGDILSRTDPRFKALADTIGITYGGDISNFRLPDLRGRVPLGSGQGDTRSSNDPLIPTNWIRGQKVGTERHKLEISEMPRHNHLDKGHNHELPIPNRGSGTNAQVTDAGPRSPGNLVTLSGGKADIDFEGGDQPHNIMQPSLVLNYIIKL
jgi:microcystin-dependent protein